MIMTMKTCSILVTILLLVLSAGCTQKAGPPTFSEKQKRQAIDHCLGVIKGLRAKMTTLGLATIRERIARGCATLYADPLCREAVVESKKPLSHVSVCRQRYCGALGSPKPTACSMALDSDDKRQAAWAELSQAILRHDLGDALYADFVAKSRALLMAGTRDSR
jgi:hypothetical protein